MKLTQLVKLLRKPIKFNQRGYAMMTGLIATLTISIIGLTAAAPQVAFDAQREKEEELLWRGAQVAQGLLNYRQARQTLPTSLEELVEGVNTGIKKVRFLRRHALCDPMLPCTPGKSNWRLVHPGDPVISEMMQSLQAYQQKKQAENPSLAQMITISINNLSQFAPQVNLAGVGLGSQTGVQTPSLLNPNPNDPNAPQQESAFGNKPEKGPIVGVVSRSKDKLIRAMLDIEQYDKGLFFAGSQVFAGGFVVPFYGFNQQQQVNPVTRCANGGIWFPDPSRPGGGGCFGGVPPVDRKDKPANQ